MFEGKIEVYESKKPDFQAEFRCYEYLGSEIYKNTENYDKLEVISDKDGIKPGDKILWTGLMGELRRGDVFAYQDGKLGVEDAGLLGILEFNIDDRACWVRTSLMCKSALARVDFS